MALTGVVVLGGIASQPLTAWGSVTVRAGRVVPAATQQTRILYASDWEGPTQIFAVDPTGRRPLGQVTFDRTGCTDVPFACGFTDPRVSADGRTIAYEDGTGGYEQHYWVANASGRGAHEVATRPRWYRPWLGTGEYGGPVPVVSPNRRWSASGYSDGILVTDRRNGHQRLLTSDSTFALSWAPNSQSIAYIQGHLVLPDSATTGDLKVVSLTGRSRTLVRADEPYGGQIVALSWTRVPKRTAYRPPLVPTSTSVFVGGPIGRLAANGSRVAFAACGDLSVWAPPNAATSAVAQIEGVGARAGPGCLGPNSEGHYYDLAVGGDRIYWGQKDWGLTYAWQLHAQAISTGESHLLAAGGSALGCSSCDGGGALAASGDLMVFGQWHTTFDSSSGNRTTTETLFRGTDAGCPCTPIAYGAAPDTIAPLVPLDTDGNRIALLRYGSVVVINANGNDLLTTGIAAAGAQITGNNLLVLTEGRLAEYDVSSGAVQHSWSLPSGTAGRDCDSYGEPHCPNAVVKLQDASHGLVALTINGQLHVLRLNTGADDTIGYATEARFMDTGIVFADGARINFIPYSGLGAYGRTRSLSGRNDPARLPSRRG